MEETVNQVQYGMQPKMLGPMATHNIVPYQSFAVFPNASAVESVWISIYISFDWHLSAKYIKIFIDIYLVIRLYDPLPTQGCI